MHLEGAQEGRIGRSMVCVMMMVAKAGSGDRDDEDMYQEECIDSAGFCAGAHT